MTTETVGNTLGFDPVSCTSSEKWWHAKVYEIDSNERPIEPSEKAEIAAIDGTT